MTLYETLSESATALGFASFGAAGAAALGPDAQRRLEQYLAEGFSDYLTKPIDPGKLENMLLEYLPEDKIESV